MLLGDSGCSNMARRMSILNSSCLRQPDKSVHRPSLRPQLRCGWDRDFIDRVHASDEEGRGSLLSSRGGPLLTSVEVPSDNIRLLLPSASEPWGRWSSLRGSISTGRCAPRRVGRKRGVLRVHRARTRVGQARARHQTLGPQTDVFSRRPVCRRAERGCHGARRECHGAHAGRASRRARARWHRRSPRRAGVPR